MKESNPTVLNTPEYNILLDEISNIVKEPKDYFEIAAALESMGFTDLRARTVFNYKDIFDLAQALLKDITLSKNKVLFSENKREGFTALFCETIRGFFSILPVLISLFSVFLINFSLWSFLDKNDTGVEKATLIASSTILSMIIAGGFSQVFLRKAYILYEQKSFKIMWNTYIQHFRTGMLWAVLLTILIDIAFISSSPYRLENLFIFNAYFLLLTAIWLCLPVLNIYKAEVIFVLNFCFSICLVYFFNHILCINIVKAQIIAMVIFVIMHFLITKTILWILAVTEENKDLAGEYRPRFLVEAYVMFPYFIYGLFYYVLIFIDRLIAWSANVTVIIEPVLRMKGEYDIGMNWGIIAIIIPVIFIESFARILVKTIILSSECPITQDNEIFTKANLKNFIMLLGAFILLCIIGGAISLGAINFTVSNWGIELNPYYNDISRNVFYTAIIGYMFIAAGLFSNIFLLYFSQGWILAKILLISTGINLLVGFVSSRIFEYYFACAGFMAGTAAFFLLSTYYACNMIKSIDFYLYNNR